MPSFVVYIFPVFSYCVRCTKQGSQLMSSHKPLYSRPGHRPTREGNGRGTVTVDVLSVVSAAASAVAVASSGGVEVGPLAAANNSDC